MAVRYRASYEQIGEQVLRSAWMRAEMLRRAEKVKALAEATAPVYEQGPHPGRYKASFSVSEGIKHGRTSRAVGRVSNLAPEAVLVEFGSKNNARHSTLRRALSAAK